MIIIYFTMALAVVLVELMHVSRVTKQYESFMSWAIERWDNITVSFISGVLLCMVFPELSLFLEEYFHIDVKLHNYPHFGGLVMGLSSTPIINWIIKVTKSKIKESNG